MVDIFEINDTERTTKKISHVQYNSISGNYTSIEILNFYQARGGSAKLLEQRIHEH